MANKMEPKIRLLKKSDTIAQRAKKATDKPAQARRLRKTSKAAARPFKFVWNLAKKALGPFAFLLIPFKTKIARKIASFLASVLLLKFIRGAYGEIKQVQWPSFRETVRLSVAVFIFSVLFGTLVAITDYGLGKVFRKLFID
jgi:preprotein translocase SecE subunit